MLDQHAVTLPYPVKAVLGLGDVSWYPIQLGEHRMAGCRQLQASSRGLDVAHEQPDVVAGCLEPVHGSLPVGDVHSPVQPDGDVREGFHDGIDHVVVPRITDNFLSAFQAAPQMLDDLGDLGDGRLVPEAGHVLEGNTDACPQGCYLLAVGVWTRRRT